MLNLTLLSILDKGAEVHGGGEILQYDIEAQYKTIFVNWNVVKLYTYIPYMFLGMALCLIIAGGLYYMQRKGMSVFGTYGISYSIARRNKEIRRRNHLIALNQFIRNLTDLVERSPFRSNKNNKDYMDYNLKRAGFKLPGNQPMYLEQYNALKCALTFLMIAFALFISIFVNTPVGILLLGLSIMASAVLPTMIIRAIVEHKDTEIRNNFMDFYLMLHYSLLIKSNTPLSKLMQSYAKTTDNPVMHQFVAECINSLDTYGEYNATEIIAKDYRELAPVGKLMRMIKQLQDGADVTQELKGFRAELITAERVRIGDHCDKQVAKIMGLIYVAYIFLFQIVLSGLAIYLPDLGGLSAITGGLG